MSAAQRIDRFYREPILNSPYEYPGRHWELDEQGQPTGETVPERRAWDRYLSPIPRSLRRRKACGVSGVVGRRPESS